MNTEYTYKILDFSNYDGDSYDLTLDLGFDLVYHAKCRLFGADTPEIRDPRPLYKAAAYLARDKVRDRIDVAMKHGSKVVFASENYAGKFGRPLGDIVIDGNSLRSWLIRESLAVPYAGQAKSEVAALHQQNIETLHKEGKI